ncbi:CLUMA_CG010132, isoform A [Clunio marinus]|uniref:CLUMA_CG010132, isoform A n=1 Tax=Clunio marinus TaxID=568069 RepID=A0A1J1I8D0_9DIPT|nr:CLUMA_CG010132, isoform A [Clunio marinus]
MLSKGPQRSERLSPFHVTFSHISLSYLQFSTLAPKKKSGSCNRELQEVSLFGKFSSCLDFQLCHPKENRKKNFLE